MDMKFGSSAGWGFARRKDCEMWRHCGHVDLDAIGLRRAVWKVREALNVRACRSSNPGVFIVVCGCRFCTLTMNCTQKFH